MTNRKWLRADLLVSAFLLGMLGYFAWHGFWSPRGFQELHALQAVASKQELELTSMQDKRKKFEQRVSLLRQESLDPDMLDEMARVQLGLLGPNDLLVHLKR
jgi:cell division protein FtsB